MATSQNRIASELVPQLELVRPLGSGSTAEVFLARDPALHRLVAVKVLHPQLAADPVARKRFEREARAVAGISHPNITVVHRISRLSGDVPYMVLEYVDGRTLSDTLEARGAFEPAEARAVLASVASALAAAHERGIVHRDLRPDNVFIENRTGRAVLADFGLAGLLDTGFTAGTRLTAVGVLMGQPSYMSPEQIRSEPVTAQSDVYALGILAYEMLTGRGPYDAIGAAELLTAHLEREPRRLRDLRPDYDPVLASLFERCLAKDPLRRPQARDVAERLARPAVSILPPADGGALSQFLLELRRRRVYRVLAGYAAIALAVLGGAQTVFEAFDLPRWAYQSTVALTLAGLPAGAILAWVYDLSAGGIRRTRPSAASISAGRGLVWAALAACILLAALLAWAFLRRG